MDRTGVEHPFTLNESRKGVRTQRNDLLE